MRVLIIGANGQLGCDLVTTFQRKGCEVIEEPAKAFAINSLAVRNLSHAANRWNTRLIHISTDYVFDGNKCKPYVEEDCPHPLNCYGTSKLSGELI
jgi:dTDP-4-dehydrorhamnose reductase